MMERFWSKVDAEGICWEWTACLSTSGYGKFREGENSVYAHRWAYEHLVGPIPAGMEIDHLCRVRHCVNPDHMEPVVSAENISRGSWGRTSWTRGARTHCPNGHEFTDENTRPDSGGRRCKTCANLRARKYRRQKV